MFQEQKIQYKAALDMRDVEYNNKVEFYDSVIITYEAAKKYIERYAKLAEEKAEAPVETNDAADTIESENN